MLPECLPELPAIANVVIVIVAVVPRQRLATLLVLNQTPMGNKRKKNVNQHINGLQLLNTTWFTPSGHKMSQS